MSELVFECLDVRAERYAAAPTLLFRLRLSDVSGETIHAIALRCQMRIEPQRRRYSPGDQERLLALFGEPERWGDTLKPLEFLQTSMMVPGFRGSTEVDLPVACTYDFEVAASRYFSSLDDGEIPLVLLFSGTVFAKGQTGFAVDQVPWHKEASYRLPVAVWREMIDLHFPQSAWLRLSRDSLAGLQGFKDRNALPTWDDTFEALLKRAGEAT